MKTLNLLMVMGVGAMLAGPASAAIVDDFESYAHPEGTEHAEIRAAWIDQTTFPNTGAFVYLNYDPAFAKSGTQSMQLARNNNNGVRDLSSLTSGTTPLSIKASVMLHDDGDGNSAAFIFQAGADTLASNTRQAHLGFVIGDTVKYRDDGVIQDTGVSVVAGQWYDVELIMKPDTDEEGLGGTYDAFIDGVQVVTDALFWHDKFKLSSAVRLAQSQSPDLNQELMFADDFEAALIPEPASLALIVAAMGVGTFGRTRGRATRM